MTTRSLVMYIKRTLKIEIALNKTADISNKEANMLLSKIWYFITIYFIAPAVSKKALDSNNE